jgi:predicted nucleic acid-binding protein
LVSRLGLASGGADLLAERAGEEFRRLGSPRRRAADVAIGVTAASYGAILLTCNHGDFEGISQLELEVVEAGFQR